MSAKSPPEKSDELSDAILNLVNGYGDYEVLRELASLMRERAKSDGPPDDSRVWSEHFSRELSYLVERIEGYMGLVFGGWK
jgi:hypothetical protein